MGGRYPDVGRFNSIYEEINRIFRELMRFDPAAERALETMEVPPVDIWETATHVVMDLELPGVDPNMVSVSFVGGKVVIEGTKEERVEEGRQNYVCMERSFGRFHRVIPIAKAVDSGRAEASYRLGILTIRLPKIEDKRGARTVIGVTRIEDPEAEGAR